jgi:hypothetical protein
MTDYDDLPRNAGSHWDYYEDQPMDFEFHRLDSEG